MTEHWTRTSTNLFRVLFIEIKMIKSERIAKKINKKIKVWNNNHGKLVVAIDGYAGSGKTTVANFIAKQNSNVLVIHLDDFIRHWKHRKQMIDAAKDKSKVFEYDWYRYEDIQRLVNQFKNKQKDSIKLKVYDFEKNDFGPKKLFNLSKKILVIEGILLFHPKHGTSKLWDKRVYLDVDFDKADKKRISREKKKWGKDYIPEDHQDNWTKHFKKSYGRYIKKYMPKKKADLILTS